HPHDLPSFPTRRSSDLTPNHYAGFISKMEGDYQCPKLSPGISADGNRLYLQSSFSTYQWFFNDEALNNAQAPDLLASDTGWYYRSEEHTSELQSRENLV